MALFGRVNLPQAIRALQSELAGGPRADLPADLELLGGLVHVREERARPKEEPEREILAALPDAAAVVGTSGLVRVANTAFEVLAPGGRAAGLSPVEITRSGELGEAVRRALEGSGRRLEVDLPSRRRTFVAHVTPLLRGEVLLLLRDVTDAKRAEATRRDFVANASHELRTPVATITGAAETLLAGAMDEPAQARHFVGMIARHAERLARLTQDLLDLSRIESGQWPIAPGRVELLTLSRAVTELHAERARERELALEVAVPAGLAARADARALEQVLVNLVDNAVKYTPRGGRVRLSAEQVKDRARLAVADTGPGIPQHHLERLFERFYRADAGRGREQGGTGLGLAIAKHLVQAQGGDIGVESGAGGTTFWVDLPEDGAARHDRVA
jgi:two-component system, OmpR family, phosphate regulon sensor histidine kinase PhoR